MRVRSVKQLMRIAERTPKGDPVRMTLHEALLMFLAYLELKGYRATIGPQTEEYLRKGKFQVQGHRVEIQKAGKAGGRGRKKAE